MILSADSDGSDQPSIAPKENDQEMNATPN